MIGRCPLIVHGLLVWLVSVMVAFCSSPVAFASRSSAVQERTLMVGSRIGASSAALVPSVSRSRPVSVSIGGTVAGKFGPALKWSKRTQAPLASP